MALAAVMLPHEKITVVTAGPSTISSRLAGTITDEISRTPEENSPRAAPNSPSATYLLIRGSIAVITDTAMIPYGSWKSWNAYAYALLPAPGARSPAPVAILVVTRKPSWLMPT